MVFILSLQVMEGEQQVVNIIEDWDVLTEYAWRKVGFLPNSSQSHNDLKKTHPKIIGEVARLTMQSMVPNPNQTV